MEIFGYLASILTGVLLGMIGGGGSILTVPILVYLFAINPLHATAYSLFVVGITSLVGIYPLYKEKAIDFKMALLFGIPSTLSVILARKIILPAIPETIVLGEKLVLSRSLFIMLFFAIIMIFAALLMIFRKEKTQNSNEKKSNANQKLIIPEAILVGTIAGISGAGGGFLIIPFLTIANNLPIKKAIGTSLLIIGIQSMIGFFSGLSAVTADWMLISKITVLSVSGFFAGNYLSRKISGAVLKNTFGWLVLSIGIYIILKELP
jgi:uncharacterized membrane protein YfcA